MNYKEGIKSIQLGMGLIQAYWLWLIFRLIQELLGNYEIVPSIWKVFLFAWFIFGMCLSFFNQKVNKNAVFALLTILPFASSFYFSKNLWEVLGYLVFTLVYGTYLTGLLTGERNIFYKFKKGNKVRNITIGIFIVFSWLKNTTNVYGLGVSIGSVVVYSFLNTYVLNVYEWYLKWLYLKSSMAGDIEDSFIQIDYNIGHLEKKNRQLAGLCLLVGLAMSSLVLLVLKGLTRTNIGQLLYKGFLWTITQLASLVLGFLGLDVVRPYAGESEVQNGTQVAQSLFLEAKKTGYAGYQGAYQYGTIILISVLAVLVTWWVIRKLRQHSVLKTGESSKVIIPIAYSVPEGKKGVLKTKYEHLEPDVVEHLVRKRYLELLKKLERQGMTLQPGQTPDELKKQLALIYPDQDSWIDLITEAYCERRYAGRDSAKMAEALAAFDQLKEVKNDKS